MTLFFDVQWMFEMKIYSKTIIRTSFLELQTFCHFKCRVNKTIRMTMVEN